MLNLLQTLKWKRSRAVLASLCLFLHPLAHIHSASHLLPMEQILWEKRISQGRALTGSTIIPPVTGELVGCLAPTGFLWSPGFQYMVPCQWSLGAPVKEVKPMIRFLSFAWLRETLYFAINRNKSIPHMKIYATMLNSLNLWICWKGGLTITSPRWMFDCTNSWYSNRCLLKDLRWSSLQLIIFHSLTLNSTLNRAVQQST